MSEEDVKKKGFRVEVDRSPEVERERLEKEKAEQKVKDLEAKLTEKDAILGQQALDAMEKRKTEIMDMARKGKLTDDQIAEIEEKMTDPKAVESIYTMVKIISDNVSAVKKELPRIPSGKASITPPRHEGEDYDSEKELIADLYRKAYDPKARATTTMEERAEAVEKINQLWSSLLKNPTKTSNKRIFDLSECPQCGFVNETLRNKAETEITCAKCGMKYKV